MASQLETTGTLERRLTLSVNPADISSKVQERLRSMAKTTRMPGFRPGKVPVRLIEQSYGPQVHAEVLGDAITRAFGDAVQAENLRVAGQPDIAPKEAGQGADGTEFVATFEVYPEISLGDPATLEVDRYDARVDDKALDATLDVLRKQRTRWNEVDRAGQNGDRATIDFIGRLDGEAFPGGSADGFPMVLGEGRMLPDFEAGVLGKKAGETVTFDVSFPEDYNASHLAGKTAQFEVTVRKVEAPELPEIDADFARQMGQEDGDVEKFRADVRENLEREVRQRVQSRTKSAVMDKIVSLAEIELPKALVAQEAESLAARMREDLKARGVDLKNAPPMPTDAFSEQAARRVRLGLIVSEVVRENALQAKPEQIRKQIEEFASTYENPAEVVRWYFSDRDRLAEVEALVVEQNVVDWLLSKAKVTHHEVGFDELMKGVA
ncbi:MAG: trigger factor [Lautropia sp.]|nr:trigger factor [Lautropia sp.]